MKHAADWVDAWENALAYPPALRAAVLLHCASPETPAHAFARLPIGERDRRLLDLRESLFGADLECVAACPECGEPMELAFSLPRLAVDDAASVAIDPVVVVNEDGYRVACRLPDSLDLAAIAEAGDLQQAQVLLLQRLAIETRRGDTDIDPAALPAAVLEHLDRALESRDAQALVTLPLRCSACGHSWSPLFDIAQHLWVELERWVMQLFHEVHTLASSYGWSEREILGQSATRRARYLELAAAGGP